MSRWSEFVSSPKGRLATIVLLTLQLGGCAFDLVTEQATFGALFCLAAPAGGALEWAGLVVWIVLSLSWLVGLAALWLPRLRPLYWFLVVAIPVAWFGQALLIHRHLLFCDAP